MLKHRLIRFLAFFLFLLPSAAFSQVGPMGIGNKDGTPAAGGLQPKLLLWLDGSDASDANGDPCTINNTPVYSWNDKSGNGNDFNWPGLPVAKPVFRPGPPFGGPSGTPGLQFFPGGNTKLVCPNFELSNNGYTIYFVVKTRAGGSDFTIFNYETSSHVNEVNIFHDGTDHTQQQMADGVPYELTGIGPLANNDWQYGGLTWTNDNSDGGNWMYNKSSEYEGTGFNSFNGITIDPTGTATIGDGLDGYIAEVIIFEGRISRPATRLMRTYLAVKYGGDFKGSSNGWDKYHGSFNAAWQGKYYSPIGIGFDIGNPNAGEQNEAHSSGLVLRVNSGQWGSGDRSYLCAAPVGGTPLGGLPANSYNTTSRLAGTSPTTIARWSRLWEIDGDNAGTDTYYQIAFDFGDGVVGGQNPINKDNFVLLGSNSATSGNFSVVNVSNSDKSIYLDQVVFRVRKSVIIANGPFFTIGTTSAASSLAGASQRTWYAYQSGNWNDPATWTRDGSTAPTYVNPSDTVPSAFDNIYIGTGRKVTVDITLPSFLDLKVYGTLDVGSQAQPTFSTIGGSGLIQCSGNGADGNFPAGDATLFADPINGGTAEFYGTGGFKQTTDLVLNKLKINLSSAAATMTLAADLTTNGLFEVNKGTFIINDNTHTSGLSRTLISNDRVIVENSGRIYVSDDPYLRVHKWYFYSDLINNGGRINFTNRDPGSVANYYTDFTDFSTSETQNIVSAYFSSGSRNQEIRANGRTYFSRLVMDKGVDMTYILSISSTNTSYFKLLGPCEHNMGESAYISESGNYNSFALVNGTVEIREKVFIPLQVTYTPAGNYNINNTVQLWINGGTVSKAPLGGPTADTGNNYRTAVVNYGIIKLSSGVFNAYCTSGITIRGNGVVQVDGGVLNTNQIRTSLLGSSNIGGLIINSGTVNIDGKNPGKAESNYYTLSLTYPGNLFRMTGGLLKVTGPTGKGLIFINSDPQNTSVTGGVVHLDISESSNSYNISSRAAFSVLNLTRSAAAGSNNFKVIGGNSGAAANDANRVMAQQDLIVRESFSINGANSPKVEMGLSSFPSDLFLYGDLTMGSGSVYQHNDNTTHFVGSSSSDLYFGGSSTFPFYNVEVNKDFDSKYVFVQNQGPSVAMNIEGSLNLERGYFNNNRKIIDLKGNITNRTQLVDTISGYFRMNGTSGRQEIISDGGIFGKLLIDNPDGVVVRNDGIIVNTWLKLAGGSLFMGNNKLRLNSPDPDYVIFGGNTSDRFVVCSGNASAGGVEILNVEAGQHLVYPVGVSSGAGLKYTPADIYINSDWDDDGYIRVAPVDTLLSTADLSIPGDTLYYYWKVSSSDYTTQPKVTHVFKYDDSDVGGDELNFESARVLSEIPFDREVDVPSSGVNTSSNLIYYNGPLQGQVITGTGTELVDADYTAGSADRFTGRPQVFFSKSSDFNTSTKVGADWDDPNNWNELSQFGTYNPLNGPYQYHNTSKPAQLDFPEEGDIAIIGFNVNNAAHKPHIYRAPSGGILAARVLFTPLQDSGGNRQDRYMGPDADADYGILRPTLQINASSDIVNVRQISGEGELMLKGDIDMGATDIGGFLSEDSSIVVIYNSNFSLTPTNFFPASIPNLFVAKGVPQFTTDIHVRGNLEIAGTSKLYLSETEKGNIEIDGDLILAQYQYTASQAQLLFNMKGNLKIVDVHGDIKLSGSKANIGINTSAGPAVPVVPWTPAEVGAQLWFDADDASTVHVSGTNVTGWDNKAGASFNSTQTVTADQPKYQASGLNGMPTIRFDGVDDYLKIAHNNALNFNANDNFEIFSVVKENNALTNADPDHYPVILAKGGLGSKALLYYIAINKFRLYMDGSFSLVAPNNINNGANMGWARRQLGYGEMYNTLGGNTSDNSAGSANTTGSTNPVTIGAALSNPTTPYRWLDGDIGEIIVVRHSLTNDERQKMEGYLAHKWGLAADLPDGHPYKNNAPTIGGNNNEAQLIVDGDIIQNVTSTNSTGNGIKLYTTSPDTAFVNLVVTKAGNNKFDYTAGLTPALWKLTVNKGTDITSSFTFNTDVNIVGPADELEKPVTIQNGLVKFNNSGIDITLSSGGGDFTIPISGGLELNDGTLKIKGDETGLLLSGLLKITGGSLTIAETDKNNYIEYAASGAPKINVSGGTLTVGSQIRRNLSSLGGALDYRQSGGAVVIGRYSAPATNRGMLEVLNPGSRFDHTDGTLTFVRGVNLGTTPSLLIDNPDNSNVSGTSEIIIGNGDSPAGAAIENFGINTSVPLNNLTIGVTGSPSSHPIVHLISHDLEVNGDLTIHTDNALNCEDWNLILHKDVTNDGLLSSTSGLVSLVHPGTGSVVGGTGDYDLYDLDRSGGISGITQVDVDLVVKNNFTNDAGEMNFGGNTLTVKRNVTTDGKLKFDAGSDGLILNGTAYPQLLQRTASGISEIDVMTINNTLGVTSPYGGYHFIIGEDLRLANGVFTLTGNLLEMAEGATFTPVNAFGETNMIVTGGSAFNFGVVLNIPAHYHDNIKAPLGIVRYMPINLDFSQTPPLPDPAFSSGSTASKYALKLYNDWNGTITDQNNALGMYFSIDGTNVGDGVHMEMKFFYDDQYVNVSGSNTEADYIAARAYGFFPNNYISKFSPAEVDETNHIITYSFDGDYASDAIGLDGDYFAGIDAAIQDDIRTYYTAHDGDAFKGGLPGPIPNVDGTYTTQVSGNTAPSGAQVVVNPTHTLTLDQNGINFYGTDIASTATVKIPATAFHRLGKVTGTGTIQLVGSGNLPAGDYSNFFGCFGGKLIYEGRVVGGVPDNFEILSNLSEVRQVSIIGDGPSVITIADNAVTVCDNLNMNGPRVNAANSALLTVKGNLNVSDGSDFDFRQGNTLVKGDLIISGGGGTYGSTVHAGNTGKATIEGDIILDGKSFGLGTIFRETHVEGNVTKNSGTITEGTGGARLVFDGIFPQTITGVFTGTSKIPSLEVNNGTGLTLDNANVDVSDTLKLTNGNIFTEGNILKLTDDGTDIDPIGGQPNSFVDGPLQWTLLNDDPERIFPTGSNDRFRPLSLSSRSGSGTDRTWEVQYTDTIARIVPSINPLMLPDPMNVPVIRTVSIQEFWRVNSNTGVDTDAKVRLSWGDNSGVSTNTTDQGKLLVLAYDNNPSGYWNSYGQEDRHYSLPTNRGDLRSNTVISFSERYLTLGSSDDINPLPVTWLYFTGENNGADNLLSWATASEQDNDYFELERSIDAHSWTPIAQITGAGHSTTKQTYDYRDIDAPFGRVYYRLKQVDFDGKKDYAPNVVSLERGFSKESEVFDFLLYPNPSQIGSVRFRMSNISDVRADVSIFDLSGKLLSHDYIQIDGQGTSSPVDCNFEPGIYLVRVIVNNKMLSKPLVITK